MKTGKSLKIDTKEPPKRTRTRARKIFKNLHFPLDIYTHLRLSDKALNLYHKTSPLDIWELVERDDDWEITSITYCIRGIDKRDDLTADEVEELLCDWADEIEADEDEDEDEDGDC